MSQVVLCLLRELLKLRISNRVLVAWGFKANGNPSTNGNRRSDKR